MTPQEFSFSGKLSKDIVRSTIWGRKGRKLTRAVFFLIVLYLTYHPRYPDRVTMFSEPSPSHRQYPLFRWCCSVTQSCLTLCDSMHSKNPGLSCPSDLPEFAQTHDLTVTDALQPSCPLLFPSSPAPNNSQHKFLSSDFALGVRWPMYWLSMFSISPYEKSHRLFPSCFTSLNSMHTTELLYVFSSVTVAIHQCFGT